MAPDTTVRCRRCGATRSVSFEAALRTGWPRCCDTAMWLEATSVEIEVTLADLFAPEAETPVGAMLQRLDLGRN